MIVVGVILCVLMLIVAVAVSGIAASLEAQNKHYGIDTSGKLREAIRDVQNPRKEGE